MNGGSMGFSRLMVYRMPVALGVFGILFLIAGIGIMSGLLGYREAVEVNQRATEDAKRVAEETYSAARSAIRAALAADTVPEWERAASAVLAVDDQRLREIMLGAILPRRILALGTARDHLVAEAFDLASRDRNDPKIRELLDRARPLEERALELIKDIDERSALMRHFLSDEEWKRWYATMRYLEGYTQFARLPFIMSDETTKANEIIQAALHAYTQIFWVYPGDERAEYAIESLYQTAKKQKSESESETKNQPKRPLLLSRPSGRSSTGQGKSGI